MHIKLKGNFIQQISLIFLTIIYTEAQFKNPSSLSSQLKTQNTLHTHMVPPLL